MIKGVFSQIEAFIVKILSQGIELTENFVQTYGIGALVVGSFTRGLMLFWIAPDEVVTISYVLFYTETFYHVAGIVLISTIAMLIGNSFVFLLFRWIGERLISDERKETKTWRFLNWAFDKNGKVSILIFRMTPLVGGDWVAIFSGITDMRFKDFLIYSFIAILLYESMIGFGAYYGLKLGALYEMDIPFVQFFINWLESIVA